MQLTMERLQSMQGSPVYDSAGEQIGKVEEIFEDIQTREPEWIGIGTGFMSMKRVLVPVQGADVREDGFFVPYSKDQVKDAPDIDADEINPETEQELYAYYGLRAQGGYDETATEREQFAGAEDAEVVRREEELQVGKRETQAGSARLRKWVETQPVEADVELRQETAHVTREPIDQVVTDGELGEQEIEVPLREEQPVVQKQTVAKERIGLEKDVETRQETVSDEVRKERVDVEGDLDRGA